MKNSQEYRDNVAGILKEIRETSPEKAEKVLGILKDTDTHKAAEENHRNPEFVASNMKKLKSLLSESYDTTEMANYLSYLNLEKAKEEIDIFEEKLNKKGYPKEELVKRFEAHLEYLVS